MAFFCRARPPGIITPIAPGDAARNETMMSIAQPHPRVSGTSFIDPSSAALDRFPPTQPIDMRPLLADRGVC